MKPLPLIGLAILATAAPSLARDKPVPVATPVGKPVSCVLTQRIRETRVRNDEVIDFVMRDGKVFRNTLPMACPRLGFEERFGYRTFNSQLCSTDMIRVLVPTPTNPGATCGLGQFQPVTLSK